MIRMFYSCKCLPRESNNGQNPKFVSFFSNFNLFFKSINHVKYVKWQTLLDILLYNKKDRGNEISQALTGSVLRSQTTCPTMTQSYKDTEPDRLRQKSWSPSSVSCVAARKIVRRSVLGASPRYSPVVDEDVKKPTNQPTIQYRTGVTGSWDSCVYLWTGVWDGFNNGFVWRKMCTLQRYNVLTCGNHSRGDVSIHWKAKGVKPSALHFDNFNALNSWKIVTPSTKLSMRLSILSRRDWDRTAFHWWKKTSHMSNICS